MVHHLILNNFESIFPLAYFVLVSQLNSFLHLGHFNV